MGYQFFENIFLSHIEYFPGISGTKIAINLKTGGAG
jgi:hypothetical protein